MYKKNNIHYLTKIFVDILFYAGIVCCIALPFVMPYLAKHFGYDDRVILPFNIILIIAGGCSLYILWQLKGIFKTLMDGSPFVLSNVDGLRKSAIASFVIVVDFAIKNIFWFSIMTTIITLIFALLGLFCLVLKDVFKQAINFKEENDWTV